MLLKIEILIISLLISNKDKIVVEIHLVSRSPWPLFIRFSIINNLFRLLLFLVGGFYFFYTIFNVFLFIIVLILWCRDVIREACYKGDHTCIVYTCIYIGMILFILGECLFFFCFFWSFFHNSCSPDPLCGIVWPYFIRESLPPFEAPLLNSLLLLSSGVTLTCRHYNVVNMSLKKGVSTLLWTILLGLSFTVIQIAEYYEFRTSINDNSFGRIFFVRTGFHGLHVIVGSVMLICIYFRLNKYQIRSEQHVGFTNRIWYWHFVDVVWLILFSTMYWWLK